MSNPIKAVAFDVIGTTFSLKPMRGRLAALGLPSSALELWFATALRDAFALAASGSFQPFAAILEAALDQVLVQKHVSATPAQVKQVPEGVRSLPPHAEARQAIETVKSAGCVVVALTNGSITGTRSLLDGAGLAPLFDLLISVDDVSVLKPRKEVYRHAAERAGIAEHELGLISTHAWDLHGAKAAGLVTGFVARRQHFPAIMNQPDVVGEELSEVARHMCELGGKSPRASSVRESRVP